jgi:hypothetical protein
MPAKTNSVEQRYAKVVQTLTKEPGVTLGSGKKGFGSGALQINAKMFAMLTSKNEFVVKLPKERVVELMDSKDGRQFDPGHGRLMKEWLVVDPKSKKNWTALAREAVLFVSGD